MEARVQSEPPVPGGFERWLHSRLFVPLILLALTLAMFAPALFLPGDRVLSAFAADISTEYVYWRQFGFDQLRLGRIALWNPYVFGGVAFLGGFQATLFYPLNWIYLVLPLAKAINFEVALHVFLVGLFMSWWAGIYRLHPLAVLVAASIAMFGTAFFLRVFGGQLGPLDSMAWAPLILLTLDRLIDEPTFKWVMVGIFAFAMQVLAGYPQVLFYTLVTCALYGAMRLVQAPNRVGTLVVLAIVGIGAVAIAAVQLWTGLQAAAESTRQAGVPLEFASSFSFPPENFLMLLVPRFFGTTGDQLSREVIYWGRGLFMWEMSLFLGLTGLTMVVFGASVRSPQRWIRIAMVLLLLAIALGSHTPMFRLLYRYAPGFDRFRSSAKFAFDAQLFLAILAAFGADAVIRSATGARAAAALLLAGALILGGLGIGLRANPGGAVSASWSDLVGAIAATGESTLSSSPAHPYADPAFLLQSRRFAGSQCVISAAVLLMLSALFFLRGSRPRAAYLIAAFAVVEIFLFAHSTLADFSLAAVTPKRVRQFVASHPGDYRILNLAVGMRPTPSDKVIAVNRINSAMIVGANDIWGYDPMVSRRYAEFITYSQGGDPDSASDTVGFTGAGPLLRLLRLKYVFVTEAGELKTIETEGGLPHLTLVGGWQRIAERNGILQALSSPSFDPLKTVILESDPDPPPSGEVSGSARLVSSDPDSMTITADIARPAILLVTDTYSRYWRAEPMGGSAQQRYAVLPADYTLLAVPLAAGHHLLRLEYAPSGYVVGRWISLAAIAAYLAALVVLVRRGAPWKRTRPAGTR